MYNFASSYKLGLYRESVYKEMKCIPYLFYLEGTVNRFRMTRGSLYACNRPSAGRQPSHYPQVSRRLQACILSVTQLQFIDYSPAMFSPLKTGYQ